MKKNLKFILKLSLMTLLLIPPLKYTSASYNYASQQNKTNWYNQKRFEDFYALEENTLDLAFLGSSHSYCTFDPEIFDQSLGTLSHQFGMPLQHIDMSYYTFREILNYQKPKVVVLELYFDMIDDNYVNEPVNDLINVLKNDYLIEEINTNVRPISEKTKHKIDFIKNQQAFLGYKNNLLMSKLEEQQLKKETTSQEGVEYYKGKGYIYADYNMPLSEFDETNQFKNYDGKKYSISSVQKNYIYKIADLAKENNIKLIFVTAPLANISQEYISNYDYIHNIFNDISKDLNVPYYDYNIIDLGLTHEHFRDDAHLNHSGVEIVSNDFINKLEVNNE